MARKLRVQYEGAIYHITVRGNGRRKIFLDDRDREKFIWRLAESKDAYQVRIYLCCLMDNHFHLLVETPLANITRFMQSVLTGYTVYFNRRHNHHGHLMQGRYGAQLVDGDQYLLRLSRYIHLNPVRTRERKEDDLRSRRMYLRAYRWNSYRGYIDERARWDVLEYGPLLGLMPGRASERPAKYRKYVEAGLTETDEEFIELLNQFPRAIGSDEFRAWVDEEYRRLMKSMGSEEDVSFRREVERKDPNGIIEVVAEEFGEEPGALQIQRRRSLIRAVAARMLCKHAGLTQRQAAKLLGFGTGAAMSWQLRKLADEIREGQGIAKRVKSIEKRIVAQ